MRKWISKIQIGRKYSQNIYLSKDLYPGYVRTQKLNNKKDSPVRKKKKDKIFKQILHEEDTWVAIRHMKKCSTSLVIRKMQIKAIMRYHYMPTEITKIRLDIWIWSGASLPRYMIFVQHVLTRKWLTMGFRLDREGNKYKILGELWGQGIWWYWTIKFMNMNIWKCWSAFISPLCFSIECATSTRAESRRELSKTSLIPSMLYVCTSSSGTVTASHWWFLNLKTGFDHK